MLNVEVTDVATVMAAQRRGRRIRFWAGFAAIALLGGLWAGLSKDPIGPGLFGDDVVFEDAPAVDVEQFPMTTVSELVPDATDDVTTTTGPDSDATDGPGTTSPPAPQSTTTGP